MSNKQEKTDTQTSDTTQQATSSEPKTRPTKNPKQVAAGKMVAERTKQAREAQKKAAAEAAIIIENNKAKPPEEAPAAPSPATEGNAISSSSLSTVQWLGVGSTLVSLVGIYYKREELKSVYKKLAGQKAVPEPDAPPPQLKKGGVKKME